MTIKNILRKGCYFSFLISSFSFGMASLSSCTDYLDKAPLSDIEETEPYKNFKNFQGYVEELYNCIPLMSGHDYHNCFNYGEEEVWDLLHSAYACNQIDEGNFWAWETGGEGTSWFRSGGNPQGSRAEKGHLWGLSWYGIHKANSGLAHLDQLKEATMEERNLLEGQLYFFRGFYHFALMQYWGGIPYIDQELGANSVFDLPRLSYQECASKAADDFAKAAELLPVDWDATEAGKATLGNNRQRINKVMALGYLGKDLLWAGSPLMNKVSTGSSDYNKDFCKRAADAFGKALTICEETGCYELADFSQWSDIFYTVKQNNKINGLKEAIFYENNAEYIGRWAWNMATDYRPVSVIVNGVKIFPTANYVDLYGMANGMPIVDITQADPESGYDPSYPFKNRDPRFYKDIIFDGVKLLTKENKQKDTDGTDVNIQYAPLYTNGFFRTNGGEKSCRTGYILTKFVPLMIEQSDCRENEACIFSFMRLADLYLMYAEATAEGYGTPASKASTFSMTAVDAINKIRDRAHVGRVAQKFLSSTDAFMSEVRRERAVELAFEGHRFVDLRRWLLLDKRPYTFKKSVEFDRAPGKFDYDHPENAKVVNLREEVILERNFSEKHYWFPFLQNDVNLYPEFNQNPGW